MPHVQDRKLDLLACSPACDHCATVTHFWHHLHFLSTYLFYISEITISQWCNCFKFQMLFRAGSLPRVAPVRLVTSVTRTRIVRIISSIACVRTASACANITMLTLLQAYNAYTVSYVIFVMVAECLKGYMKVMNVVLGLDSTRLYWAGDILDNWDEFVMNHNTWSVARPCWPAVQRFTTMLRMPPFYAMILHCKATLGRWPPGLIRSLYRSRDQSYTLGMIHTNISVTSPGCPRPNIVLHNTMQNYGLKHHSFIHS